MRSLRSLFEEMMQVQQAYDHDGPAYLLDRLANLTGELREWCDGTDKMIAQMQAGQGDDNVSHFDDTVS